MRSVTAVLRITREQLESRGDLGKQPYFAAFFGSLAAFALAASLFLPDELRTKAFMLAGGMVFAALVFGVGALSTRRIRAMNLHQERAIRERAGAALEQLLQHDFPLKALTREQDETLREIRRQCGEKASFDRLR